MDSSNQAEQELNLIKKIMVDSRNVVLNNGWHYIMWGVVVTAALIANFFMSLYGTGLKYIGWMWLVLMIGAAIAAGVIERRAEKKRRVNTFAGKLLGSLWFAAGISMFMIGFIGPLTGAYNPVYICPIISIVLGIGYFTSGAIQQIKWMKMLSVGWWAGAVLLFIFPGIHTLLVFAVMLFFFQTIPGIILNNKYKRESPADIKT